MNTKNDMNTKTILLAVILGFTLIFKINAQCVSYPGGEEALRDYINIKYSRTDLGDWYKRSSVKVIFDKNGKAHISKFISDSGKEDREEISSIISRMPRWKFKSNKRGMEKCSKIINFPSGKITNTYLMYLYRKGKPMRLPDVMPVPSVKDLYAYIRAKITDNNKKEGMLVVRFVVNRDGSLSDFKIVRPTQNTATDKKIIQIMRKMPNWKPATFNNEKVRCLYTIGYRY